MKTENRLKQINQIVENIEPELRTLALEIHANPELGLEEYKACKLQVELLKKYGFQIESPYCGMDTAYRATYKGAKAGPRIAMLAEYDALPGVGHACGHNLIAMIGVGAGIGMRQFADELGGEICVIGTPAEETKGGKVYIADAAGFDDLDAAMMTHPDIFDGESGDTLAVRSVRFHFHGKTAHAATCPEKGINALDGVISLFNMINALRQQISKDSRIHGVIPHGGDAPNIIPDYAMAYFYVRAARIDDLEKLLERVCDCARGAATGTGCRLEIQISPTMFCDTNSNRALTAVNTACMKQVGLELQPPAPVELLGSSDVGNASYRCPIIQTSLDITEGVAIPCHSPEFCQAAKSEFGLAQSIRCIKGHILTGIRLMEDPVCIEKIQEEFSKISRRSQ